MSGENPLATASFEYQRHWSAGPRAIISRRLPRALRKRLKYLALLPFDVIERITGRRKALVPPRRLNYAGDGEFEATGNEFMSYFMELGGLKPGHRVLEIGSGIGRMARPLTDYLTSGTYDGVDIVPRGVRWCQREIGRRYPQFHFHLADITNPMYNPRGRFKGTEYQFPFQNNSFDFVFLTSVFTHMMTPEVEHYTSEIFRMLQPGGKFLATFFLLNQESRDLIRNGSSSLEFRFSHDGAYIDDENDPARAVAFEQDAIAGLLHRKGFAAESLYFGAWCGRSNYLSFQDILVCGKS